MIYEGHSKSSKPFLRRFRKMILLRLQTKTYCKTKTSITDICLLFSVQVKPTLAVNGYEILKMDKTEALGIVKCLQKKDITPEDTFALKCYRTLLIHQIQFCLNFICSLNSNHSFLVAILETIRVVEDCLGV